MGRAASLVFFPDEDVLAPVDEHAATSFVAAAAFVPAHLGLVQLEVSERASPSFMALHSLGHYGCHFLLAFFATCQDSFSGELDGEVADNVSVVFSSTKHSLPISAPSRVALITKAPLVTAPVTARSIVVSVAALAAVVPVVFSSTLPPSVPTFSTYPSSRLAFTALVPWSIEKFTL